MREIRKTRSRFISIMMLVVIAVSFLFGLRMAAPDMEASMDAYLDQQELMDVHILSTLGLTQEDVEAVSQADGTLEAEGCYSVDALATGGSAQDTITVKAISLSESGINSPALTEGRLPEAADECLVEESLLTTLGLELGDTITLDTGTGTYEGALNQTVFTIVGTGQSPLYVSLSRGTSTLGNGSVSAIVMLSPEAYALDYFTDLYILVEGAAELNTYEDDYEELIDAYIEDLEEIQSQREEERTQEIKDEAQAEIDDAWSEYNDAQAEAEQELADAAQELEDAAQELEEGWQEYEDGLSELEDAAQQIAEAEQELADAKQTLEEGEQDYAEGYAQYEEGEQAYQEGLEAYESGYALYQDAVATLQDAQEQYQSMLDVYEAGEAAYADGLSQYEAGEASYEEGLAQYQAGEGAYEESLAQYEAGLAAWQSAADSLEAQRQALLESGLDEDAVDALLAEAQATLDQEKESLDQAQEILAESRTQLDETKALLDASRTQLDETKAQLAESRAELDAAKVQLAEAAEQIASGTEQLNENEQTLAASKAQLEESRAELDAAKAELEDARQELDEGWEEYESGLQELADARQQVEDSEAELADAYTQLVEGEQEYQDGLEEYESAKEEAEQELADARQEIEDAQSEVDSLSEAEWYVLDRSSNTGFASYQQDAQRMNKLAALFPTVFFLVAALVCLTTMTRMVEEERTQIGGLKALGYSKLDIARKYVGYGLAASLIGGVIGLVLGAVGIPWVIVTCWKVMYDYPGVSLTFSWPTAIVCMLAAVACCTIAVLVAALATLRATPATLMRPKAPEPGKRVWMEYLTFLWKRMSFSQKVTARNLFRYQKRFWMTVIGIAGCAALMVSGFGLRDSIMDVVDLQYEDISTYSAVLYIEDDLDEAEIEELTQAIGEESEIEDYASCYLTSVTLESSTYSLSGSLLAVEQPEDLEGFWTFRDRTTGESVEMESEGALISEKTADLLGLSVGDSITVISGDDRGTVEITGIVENYVQHYIYMTKGTYEQAFGTQPDDNEILLSYPEDADWETFGSRLLELDSVSGIYYVSESEDMIRNQLNGVYPAVIIIICAAAALAFVVLYNLSSINITERLRELATLRVLGFRDREMRSYVFRENLVLTLIGMVLGLILGKFFHQYLITTVEVELVMFGRSAHTLSYVLAAGLTLLFALLVNAIAGKRLSKIDMVESLKTVE